MASSEFFKSLIKGQVLKASIEEITSARNALCNFQGELLLISNYSGQPLKKGDPILLQVTQVDPLQFQIFDRHAKFERVV